MKTIWMIAVTAACLSLLSQVAPAQVGSSKANLSRAERKELRIKSEEEHLRQVDSLVSYGDYVLEPNQLGGFNVNPVMNFVMLTRDNVVFQTSSPVDRSRANFPYTDKTVIGKITSKEISTSKKGTYLVKLGMMTQTGVGFRIDLRISPNGNASASVTQNNAAGRLDYSGPIVSLDESSVFVGSESYDLAGFPWYYNFAMAAWYGRN